MGKITIPELCEEIEKSIVSMPTVCEFYIGKTDNIEQRRSDHYVKDGCQVTLAVATSCPEMINEAEKQVIAYFKEKNNSKIKNIGSGGEGPDGTILYVALKLEIKEIYEIEDLDINVQPYEIKKNGEQTKKSM